NMKKIKSMADDVDYVENYTGTAPIGDLYLLECIALTYRMDVYEDDLTQAYCHMEMPLTPAGEKVIVTPSRGTRTLDEFGRVEDLEMIMALYGHPVAGFALARGLHNRLLNRDLKPNDLPCPFKFKQCPAQPVIFRAQFFANSEHAGEYFVVWLNNDNIRTYVSPTASKSAYAEFRQWLGTVFDITGEGTPLRTQKPQTCLGVQIEYNDEFTRMSMAAYIKKAIAKAGMTDCNPAPTPMVAGLQLNKKMGPSTDEEKHATIDKVNVMFSTAITNQFGRNSSLDRSA
ncbi:TPA: hypothetical protein EYO57_17515, partial [Candidatus Poribacteria bacterium]|nr:hypothetical protein [Candidatus Poribacteria bacterium]